MFSFHLYVYYFFFHSFFLIRALLFLLSEAYDFLVCCLNYVLVFFRFTNIDMAPIQRESHTFMACARPEVEVLARVWVPLSIVFVDEIFSKITRIENKYAHNPSIFELSKLKGSLCQRVLLFVFLFWLLLIAGVVVRVCVCVFVRARFFLLTPWSLLFHFCCCCCYCCPICAFEGKWTWTRDKWCVHFHFVPRRPSTFGHRAPLFWHCSTRKYGTNCFEMNITRKSDGNFRKEQKNNFWPL